MDDGAGARIQRAAASADSEPAPGRASSEAIEATGPQLRAILESISDGFYILDRHGAFSLVNAAAARYLGVPAESMIGKTPAEIFPSFPGSEYDLLFQDALRSQRSAKGEFAGVVRTERVSEITAIPLDGGGLAVCFKDVTERRQAEQVLRNSEDAFRTLAEVMPAFIWITDRQGGNTYTNRRYQEALGRSEEDLLRYGWSDTIHHEDRERVGAVWANCLRTGNPYEVTLRFCFPDGECRWFLVRGTPVRDAAGAIDKWIGTCADIHDQVLARETLARSAEDLERQVRERSEELIQLQKMESLGQLTGGIAHDFNNLLTPILGALDLVRRKDVLDERSRRLLDGSLQSAERARTLVSRLLTFARRQNLKAEAVDLARLVEGMAELVTHSIGPRVTIRVEDAGDLPPCLVDPNQLELALLNLCVNARDAMPDGGAITISLAQARTGDGERPQLAPGRYVVLAVQDSGSGMDEAVLSRAMEPFFSTKGVGKGTGLGLAMVHGLAAQSGGALFLSSTPGIGTRAEIWLPVAETDDVAAPLQAPATTDLASLDILLVDDESLVRASTAEMLESFGHRVCPAASADEALGLLRSGYRPDAVVTDHLMPGRTGAELAREVRAAFPGLPVLLVTGYSSVAIADDLPVLAKPFRAGELNAALAELKVVRAEIEPVPAPS